MGKSVYAKQITKINERIADIYRTFGKENSTYKSIVAYLDVIINKEVKGKPKGATFHKTARGAIAISQSQQGGCLSQEQINKLLNYTTRGQIEKSARERLARVGVMKPTKKEIKRVVSITGDFHDFVKTHQGEIYRDEKLYKMLKGGRGSLDIDEMIEIIESVGKPKEIGKYIDPFKKEISG